MIWMIALSLAKNIGKKQVKEAGERDSLMSLPVSLPASKDIKC